MRAISAKTANDRDYSREDSSAIIAGPACALAHLIFASNYTFDRKMSAKIGPFLSGNVCMCACVRVCMLRFISDRTFCTLSRIVGEFAVLPMLHAVGFSRRSHFGSFVCVCPSNFSHRRTHSDCHNPGFGFFVIFKSMPTRSEESESQNHADCVYSLSSCQFKGTVCLSMLLLALCVRVA